MPGVGLQQYSGPCKRWEPAETCGIRSSRKAMRPSPDRKVWILSTPPFAAEMGHTGQAGVPALYDLGGLSGWCHNILQHRPVEESDFPRCLEEHRNY